MKNTKLIIIMMVVPLTATMMLVWLGELISEKKMGNGISLLIFAGIIALLTSPLVKKLRAYF